MQKQMETAMQSANMKKHLEKVVGDTISSPLLQTKWQELILKAGEVKPVDGGGEVVVAVVVVAGGNGGGGGGGKRRRQIAHSAFLTVQTPTSSSLRKAKALKAKNGSRAFLIPSS